MVGRDHTRPGGAPVGRSGCQTSAPSKRHFLGSDDLGWSPNDPGLFTGPGSKGQSTWVAQTQHWPRPPGLGHLPYNHHTGASQHGLYWNTPNVLPIGLPGTGLQTSSSARASGNNGLLSNFQSPPPSGTSPSGTSPSRNPTVSTESALQTQQRWNRTALVPNPETITVRNGRTPPHARETGCRPGTRCLTIGTLTEAQLTADWQYHDRTVLNTTPPSVATQPRIPWNPRLLVMLEILPVAPFSATNDGNDTALLRVQ